MKNGNSLEKLDRVLIAATALIAAISALVHTVLAARGVPPCS